MVKVMAPDEKEEESVCISSLSSFSFCKPDLKLTDPRALQPPSSISLRHPLPSLVAPTLRDGETFKEKLDIARQLSKLGADIIEVGFPAASKDDFEAVKQIAMEAGNAVDKDGCVPVICGLSRCNGRILGRLGRQ